MYLKKGILAIKIYIIILLCTFNAFFNNMLTKAQWNKKS